MSDEHQRPDDAARGGSEPDETRQFDAPAVDENQPDGGPRSSDGGVADRTEQMPRTAAVGDEGTGLASRPDATSVMPAAERGSSDDETVVASRPDATSVMPAAERDAGRDDAGAGGVSPAWTGRAEVRPPQPGPGGDSATRDWDAVPPPREPRGRWWMPIVVGIAVLVLVALSGWGFWLILRAWAKDGESPVPAATTSAAAPATTEPASTPSTTTPTTSPSTTEPTGPAEVTIPALKGLSSDEARRALDRTGLAYRLRFVTSTDAAPGTVIDSDPAEGQQVPSDTTVTLIVASAPSSAATATPTSTAPTDTNGQPDDD